MSTSSDSGRTKTVFDILHDIEAEVKVQYKSKDGQHYSSVPIRTLNSWSVALESALKQQDSFSDAAEASIKEAQDELKKLQTSAENYEKTITGLRADVAIGKGKALEADKRLSKLLQDNKDALAKAQAELKSANASKSDTLKLLKLTEEELGTPDAKFLPETAASIKAELKLLREELATANQRIASATAATSAGHKTIDTLSKELAAAKREESSAVAKLMQFERERKGAAAGIKELFDVNKLDVDALVRAIGTKGLARLREALALDPSDAKGRMSRLASTLKVGMHSATKGFSAYLKQLLSVVDHALQVMKNNGNSWSAILAPWVNEVLKDVALLSTKSIKDYRQSLSKRIDAVSALPKNTPMKKKFAAAVNAEADPVAWAEVGKRNRDAVRKRLGWFSTAKARVGTVLAGFSASMLSLVASTRNGVVAAVGGIGRGVASLVKGTRKFARVLYSVIVVGVVPAAYVKVPKRDKGKGPAMDPVSVSVEDVIDESIELDPGI